MAKLLKLRRGSTTQHSSFTGAEGEVTIDTTKDTAVVHDGSQAGGRPLAREDMSNVPAGTILGTQLENSGVTAGQYGSSSAIPIVTVDAQGLVTAASTTAIDSTTIANGSASVAVSNNGPITSNANHDFGAGIDITAGHLTLPDQSSGNGKIKLGAGVDLQLYHNGTDSFIENSTGSLYIRDTSGGDVRIQGKSGEDSIICHDDDGVHLYYDNGVRLTTESYGVNVTGNLDVSNGIDLGGGNITLPDTSKVHLGGNNDLQLYHDGSNSYIKEDGDGSLLIWSTGSEIKFLGGSGAETLADFDVDGACSLYHNNAKKIETSSTGVTVTGTVAATSYTGDGSSLTGIQPFPSGTKMIFNNTSAPTGWTKVTSNVHNKALRVVDGNVGSGGTNAFTSTFGSVGVTANAGNTTQGGNISVANTTAGGNLSIDSATTGGTVSSHTLTVNEIPSHSHNLGVNQWRGNSTNYRNSTAGVSSWTNANSQNWTHSGNGTVQNAGGGGGHSHGFTGGSHNHNGSLSGTAHTHNASFTGSAHNHSISVNNIDLAVQYIDVIIATKD